MICGVPIIEDADASLITKAIMAMRGLYRNKHRLALKEGTLKLNAKPMSYKGNAMSWARHIRRFEEEKRIAQAPYEDDEPEVEEPFNYTRCPGCEHEQQTRRHKLKPKVGFSQFTCHRCRNVTTTAQWSFMCKAPWCKCDVHAHEMLLDPLIRFATVCFSPFWLFAVFVFDVLVVFHRRGLFAVVVFGACLCRFVCVFPVCFVCSP